MSTKPSHLLLPKDIESIGKLKPFNDGHIPETFSKNNDNSSFVLHYDYDKILTSSSSSPTSESSFNDPIVHIWNNALPEQLTDRIYDYTTSLEKNQVFDSTSSTTSSNNNNEDTKKSSSLPPTWGTYVSIQEALDHFQSCTCHSSHDYHGNIIDSKTEHELAVAAVAHFLFDDNELIAKKTTCTIMKNGSGEIIQNNGQIMNNNHHHNTSSIHDIIKDTIEQGDTKNIIHGIGVWSLSSSTSQNVPYHIDYAEYIRYKYNIVVPPLYAGTVQCTRQYCQCGRKALEKNVSNQNNTLFMKGGDFALNLNGWDHYELYGYKGCKNNKDIMGGLNHVIKNEGKINIDSETQWVTIPYQFNQGIIHTGHLPHLSTTIDEFYPRHTCLSSNMQKTRRHSMKRVIMGFNIFAKDVGPLVSKVPEHSESFRRWVKWYRTVVLKINNIQSFSKEGNNENDINSSNLKIDKLRKNKPLMKLLVLAKREKIKQEWKICRLQMTKFIIDQLLIQGKDKTSDQDVSIKDIPMDYLVKSWRESDMKFEGAIKPTDDDFIVHIQYLSKLQNINLDEVDRTENYRIQISQFDDKKHVSLYKLKRM